MNIFVPGGEEDVPSDHSNSFVKEKQDYTFLLYEDFNTKVWGHSWIYLP
jgi:hypothetical protein